jgi:hypothetical protein
MNSSINPFPRMNRMNWLTPYLQTGGIERRKDPAPGYTFISSVGWICRRERFRRKQDPDTWACCNPW